MLENPVDAVSVSWARIDAWLAANAPKSFEAFAPPATAADIQAAEAAVDRPLPADLRDSLLCHDGMSSTLASAFPSYEMPLSAKKIASLWADEMDLQADYDDEGETEGGWRNECGEPFWWHTCWFPWAEANGDAMFIDNRPGPEQGKISWHQHDSGPIPGGYPSLAHYLYEVAEALYSTGVAVDNQRPYLRHRIVHERIPAHITLVWQPDETAESNDELRPAPIGPPPAHD
jgi:cell wall assembly regulator SMI1